VQVAAASLKRRRFIDVLAFKKRILGMRDEGMACYISTAGCRGDFFKFAMATSYRIRVHNATQSRWKNERMRSAFVSPWAQTERGVFLALGLTRLINSQLC
jgi:hypothetical protein